MAQEWGEVNTFQVPEDVYDDFLECYLLLNCARRMYMLCIGEEPPPSVGMLPRNDLLQWLADCLSKPMHKELLAYADSLAIAFSGRAHPSLPRPIKVDAQLASSAETLARHLLESGTCPLWSAARQVALQLREKPFFRFL